MYVWTQRPSVSAARGGGCSRRREERTAYVDEVGVEALLEVVVDGIVGDGTQHHHVVHAMFAGVRLPSPPPHPTRPPVTTRRPSVPFFRFVPIWYGGRGDSPDTVMAMKEEEKRGGWDGRPVPRRTMMGRGEDSVLPLLSGCVSFLFLASLFWEPPHRRGRTNAREGGSGQVVCCPCRPHLGRQSN